MQANKIFKNIFHVRNKVLDVHGRMVYPSIKNQIRRDSNMDSFKQYLQYQKKVTEAKLDVIDQFIKGTEAEPIKRTSKIDFT